MEKLSPIAFVARVLADNINNFINANILAPMSSVGRQAFDKLVANDVFKEQDMRVHLTPEEQAVLDEELDFSSFEKYMGDTLFEQLLAEYPEETREAVDMYESGEAFQEGLFAELFAFIDKSPDHRVVRYTYIFGNQS